MWALTSEAIMLTGDTVDVTSGTTLGFDGRRPLRPFRLSVLTTRRRVTSTVTLSFHHYNSAMIHRGS